jgi:predicted nucleotidyltransferase
MRTDLDHLPESKRTELNEIVRILFEAFETAIAGGTHDYKRKGRILKVILYGSYARGDWVDDPVGGYQSDYDILVIVNYAKLTDTVDIWSAAEDRLLRETTITKSLSAPVSVIVHTLRDVNDKLRHGRPFFVDLVAQGIALYEAEGFAFDEPRKLAPEKARAKAQEYFDYWFEQAVSAKMGADFYIKEHKSRDAAFLLHQATERFYHCALLVLTLYSPKSHKLNFLRSHAEDVAPALAEAWPRGTKFERRCFELLREAYVNARYSAHYEISNEELRWLAARIEVLQRLVREVCEARLGGE